MVDSMTPLLQAKLDHGIERLTRIKTLLAAASTPISATSLKILGSGFLCGSHETMGTMRGNERLKECEQSQEQECGGL